MTDWLWVPADESATLAFLQHLAGSLAHGFFDQIFFFVRSKEIFHLLAKRGVVGAPLVEVGGTGRST